MVNEFEQLKENIKGITRQEFNRAHSLIGTIIDYTPDMKYCDIKVRMKGGEHVFPRVPAHGFPVKGSSAIIHFHDGHLEQPFCDCEYRMNPPDETLREMYTTKCFNWVNNGDFYFGSEGFRSENGNEVALYDEGYTSKGKGCTINGNGSFIEFNVDLSECETKYFKFQCFYRGLDYLKVECYNTDTNKVIQNVPIALAEDYKIWSSPLGRFNWAYNKEVYPYGNPDNTLNDHILIRLTTLYNEKNYPNRPNAGAGQVPHGVMVDGLLVYSENGDTHYYNSKQDMLKYHNLEE